ncbi:MAG: bifunctional proline dehydrogenase/L-glutamate gamma-semialdehyde dehydrogenase, partial [bacterium]|nr:bifunctional proline dehydrogenase/L-glutamate gamma-semialdehyde dehydrogenase [bacterium]
MPDDDVLIDEAQSLALRILERSLGTTTRRERSRSARLSGLLADVAGRDLLLDLTDQVLRIREPRRAARRLRDLTRSRVPRSLPLIDRIGLASLGRLAPLAPRSAERAVDWRIDRDTSGVILPADDPAFADYVRTRREEGFRLNINVLGESILGDDEAAARCQKVLERIQRPDVNYVSVKISALCANLDVLAEEDSLRRIADRLRELYRAASATSPATFVNMDMEEYRDLELSVRSFMDVLDEPEFFHTPAGIVLQAYIPDSHGALERLCLWANGRHADGAAGIKIRLVKGANLAMELVDAELHDWTPATFPSKLEVDASYKRMLESALDLGDPGAVSIGVASHNLFEVAWAITVCRHRGELDRLEIEMLEGMAPPQARAVRDEVGGLLLYSPVVERADREASIAYLSRRLDENSSPDNFLNSLFDLAPGSPAWELEADRFRQSVRSRYEGVEPTFRTQDRSVDVASLQDDEPFENCADTDFTVAANRTWVAHALASTTVDSPELVDTVAGVDALISRAADTQTRWRETSWAQRREVLSRVAVGMEADRGRTLAVMAATASKTVPEGDAEISEAVDFTRYAAHLTYQHEELIADGMAWNPHAIVVVAGPWNFPYAIPASGVVHALAAGGAVILKPAPETREVAALLVDQLVRAGVPDGLVQLACTPDNAVGRHLVTHPAVDLMVLTGSHETASMFLGWRPDMRLHAETSGKNALIITAAADIDQAIKDLVRSAFGHAGQKCSAASLAIVEASVYDDPTFAPRLADAVRSLRVGDPRDFATRVGPLITAPAESLERALTSLDPGEAWLVEPRRVADAENLWSPGVRMGVASGSWFHLTECFGPVLGLMRAQNLDDALSMQNAPAYGLTGGLHSLDPREIDYWLARVDVGNAYVNRHITGAIVQRQPFGGWKASSIGPGHKPGGPHHLHDYGDWADGSVRDTVASFRAAWSSHFSRDNDATGLDCETNVLRYRPLSTVVLAGATPEDIATARLAGSITGTAVVVASDDDDA